MGLKLAFKFPSREPWTASLEMPLSLNCGHLLVKDILGGWCGGPHLYFWHSLDQGSRVAEFERSLTWPMQLFPGQLWLQFLKIKIKIKRRDWRDCSVVIPSS